MPPGSESSNILGVLAKTYRVPGRHECLPYSKNVKCSKIYKQQFFFVPVRDTGDQPMRFTVSPGTREPGMTMVLGT